MSKRTTFHSAAEKPLMVCQWGAKNSSGPPLRSENFTSCHCLLVVNLERDPSTQKEFAQLLHIVGGELLQEQYDALKAFSEQPGQKVAVALEGSRAYPTESYTQSLKYLGIKRLPYIRIETGRGYWHVDFFPQELKIEVTSDNGVKKFSPFPERYDLPNAVRGLSLEKRFEFFLAQYATEKGNLQNDIIRKLGEFLEKTIVEINSSTTNYGSLLFDTLVTERAKNAGFEDYCQYFEADPKNFTDIAPGGLELVLRRITLNPASVARFKKDGIDPAAIPVTPRDVILMFNNYFHLLDRFVRENCPLKEEKPDCKNHPDLC